MDTHTLKKKKPKVIGVHALISKKYHFLEDMEPEIERAFGKLVAKFVMIVWAKSYSGKSNFIYKFIAFLTKYFKILYISLEEGFEATAQMKALRHLNVEQHGGKIFFANHEMTYDETVALLKKKKSPQVIVVDSLKYWDMDTKKYSAMKAMFPNKIFIFIAHAKGKNPDGRTAIDVRYDADIKVFCDGFVAFVESRFNERGETPYVIWEEGAIKKWSKRKVNEFKK